MMITPRQNCSFEKVVTQEAVKSLGPSAVLLTRSAPRHKSENAAPGSKTPTTAAFAHMMP
jgi:hypothetical protein